MKQLLTALILGLLTTSALSEPADEIRCREIGFSKSAEERNLEAFRSFIDTDARFVSNTVLRGVDAVTEAWAVFFTADGPSIKWRPEVVEVLENGELALSRGPYRVIAQDADGNLVENWGTFNSVWRLNDDGEWRVVFDAGSPAAAAPGDDERAFLDAADSCP
jgi:ketosteroid isomerase-like protein